jgi:Lactonase, 7-bladed beta-propeller
MVDRSTRVRLAAAAMCMAMSLAACTGGVHDSGSGGTPSEPQYTVGGTVSGLSGSGLVLATNTGETLNVSGNGSFTFKTTFPAGSPYYVLVLAQPGTPTQTCLATNSAGTVEGANVTGVTVACQDKTAATDTIGGVVVGLTGSGLVLQNGSDTISVASNGTFVFPTALPSGTQYNISVLSPPINPNEDCAVLNGQGTTADSDVVNIGVVCTVNSNPTHTIAGTVTGVSGTLVLEDNGRDDLTITADGPFKFPLAIPSGSSYDVTTKSAGGVQSQVCTFVNATGMVGDSDITNVTITCTANAGVTATVSGLAGTGLTLQNTANGDSLPVAANGTVVFPVGIGNGQAYNVTVTAQPTNPSQTCLIGNGAGTAPETTPVTVTCTTNTYTVGGTVTGFPDPQAANSSTGVLNLVLRDSAGDTVTIPPTSTSPVGFTFPTPIPSGSTYSVSIQAQPGVDFSGGQGLQTSSVCIVSGGGTGTVTSANVVNVAITCVRPGGFAYVTNSTDNTISTYIIDGDTGALLPSGAPVSTGTSPTSAVMAPSGNLNGVNFLYVANGGSSNLSEYGIDPNMGTLTALAGSPFTMGGLNAPTSLAAFEGPQMAWLYATNPGTGGPVSAAASPVSGSISGATYDTTTGTLTDIAGTPFPTGFQPTGALNFYDVSSALYYLVETNSADNTLSSFQLGAAGTLQIPQFAPTAATGNVPTSVAGLSIYPVGAEASNDMLYVANSGDNTLSSYNLTNGTGDLYAVATIPTNETGLRAVAAAGDIACPCYVFASVTRGIAAFSAAQDGTLTALTGTPFAAGAGPGPIATLNFQYVYVVNTTDQTITGYAIQGTNLPLVAVPGQAAQTGRGPTSIVVIPRPAFD